VVKTTAAATDVTATRVFSSTACWAVVTWDPEEASPSIVENENVSIVII